MGTYKEKPCLHCKKQFRGHKRDQGFCSRECFQNWLYKSNVDRWLAGQDAGWKGNGTIKPWLKRWLVEKYGEKCSNSNCGWEERNPVTGRVPIQVDHIDGDWRNNRPENLRILCPNCHSLTPTYGALNMGKGRDKKGLTTRKKYKNARPTGKTKRPKAPLASVRKGNYGNKPSLNFSKSELEVLVWQKPTSHIGKEYKVSGNAISKWCKKLGVTKPPRGYWAKLNQGKKHIALAD